MLCSKLHCIRVLKLKLFSYKNRYTVAVVLIMIFVVYRLFAASDAAFEVRALHVRAHISVKWT